MSLAPLSERRAGAKLITHLKARTGIIELPLGYLKSRHSSTRSHNHNYFIPPSSVDSHLYSFFPNRSGCGTNFHNNLKTSEKSTDFICSLATQTLRTSYN